MLARRILVLALAWLAVAAGAPAMAQEAKPVTVFAASSLTDALQQIGEAWRKQTGHEVRFSFTSSSTLARQIEAGAPAEVFVSADAEWMDYVQKKGLIQAPTRRDLLSNRLVLIAPKDSPVRLKIAPGFALAAALKDGRLALADPAHVPAGLYAKAALTKLGVWSQVEAKVVPSENVRTALAYVARGEAPLGVVYWTDAQVEPKVRVVDIFPEATHPTIVYPAALTTQAGPEAKAFLAYLHGGEAKAIFKRLGFIVR